MSVKSHPVGLWSTGITTVFLALYFGVAWLMWKGPFLFGPIGYEIAFPGSDYLGSESPIWAPAFAVFELLDGTPPP